MSEIIGRAYWQNYIVLSSVPSPGTCIITGASAPRKWQVNDGYGLAGANVVYIGESLAKFSCTLQMWTNAQLREWDRFALLLAKPPKGAKSQAMSIQHPLLDEKNIKSVVVDDVTQLTPSPSGLWAVEIKFIQYHKPTPALGRPNGSIPDAAKKAPTPQDAQDIQIEKSRAAFAKAQEDTE